MKDKNSKGTPLTWTACCELDWRPMSEEPPEKFGWYAAAVNPVNADEATVASINAWREQFGFTKVWYNANSSGKWWEPDPHGQGSQPIGHRMTHWAKLPPVPLIVVSNEPDNPAG